MVLLANTLPAYGSTLLGTIRHVFASPIGLESLRSEQLIERKMYTNANFSNSNTHHENFAMIKGFIDETIKIVGDTIKGKRPKSYTRIEGFSGQDTAIRDFLPTGMGVD